MANDTSNLISSEKVEGTAVYGPDSEKIGSVESVMIDKVSGKVAYAVLSFGGFLGMGDEHYPLPWQTLKYDTTKAQLEGAPKYANDSDWDWSDTGRARSLDDYYGTPWV